MFSFSGVRALVTGGLGFIGSNLSRRLVHLGARVLVVDSLIPESGANLRNISGFGDQIRVNISDLRDPHSIRHLVQGQDILFNLAAQTSHLDSMTDPVNDLEVNCRAQLCLLEACRRYNPNIKIVYASTRQVYGRPRYLPVYERHPVLPVDINGINKLCAESYHNLYKQAYGIRSCVLRLTNTVGPGMRIKDARQNFLGIWIASVLRGESFEVWGGQQLRDFTYVDDCVEAMLLAAGNENANGQTFNLGVDCVIRLKELAEMLIEVNGSGEYRIRSFPEDRAKIDMGDFYSDYALIRTTLGWEPRVGLKEAIRRTVEFYKANLEHYL